jgi:TraG P-loop domain/Helicase HerA, central domain
VAPFVPAAVSAGVRHVQLGPSEWVATLVVSGYPRDVYAGWLGPFTQYPGRVDVCLHIVPIDPATAASRLRRQLARLESGRRWNAEHGRLLDPHTDAATEDAYTLAERVARGEGRLFQVGLCLTVHAADETELTGRVEEVRTLAASMLLDAHPTPYRARQGWVTGLPLGLDKLAQHRTFDTDALAAAFPFASSELPTPIPIRGAGAAGDTAAGFGAAAAPAGGVLYGFNLGSRSLVFWDRFGFVCDNYNAVVLGRSGAGKSYLVKLELLRSLYRGIEAHVIDPEDEYSRLAHAVGGAVVAPGAPGVHLNPFELPITTRNGRRTAARDALTRRALFLHTFLAVLFAEPLSAIDRAVLDTAITDTYTAAGITDDPHTWSRPAPLLADLRASLTAAAEGVGDAEDPDRSGRADPAVGVVGGTAARLAAMLHPFTDGAFAELFTRPTSTRPDSHLVVWSLRELPEPLRPVGTLLALDAVWSRVTDPTDRWPRLVVVDEAWLLLQQPAGAQFLLRAAKSGRKHWAGLTIATQDTADVLGTDPGRAVVTNAATQILLRQAPQAIDAVVDTFGLSDGERAFLLSADRGQALLSAGVHRVAFQAVAADAEHHLITTDPAELAELAARDDDRAARLGEPGPPGPASDSAGVVDVGPA